MTFDLTCWKASGGEENDKRKSVTTYTAEQLKVAVEEVKKGMKLTMASKRYNIPLTTLGDHARRGISKVGAGSPTILTENEEKEIVVSVQVLQEIGFGLTKELVGVVVRDYLKDQPYASQFSKAKPHTAEQDLGEKASQEAQGHMEAESESSSSAGSGHMEADNESGVSPDTEIVVNLSGECTVNDTVTPIQLHLRGYFTKILQKNKQGKKHTQKLKPQFYGAEALTVTSPEPSSASKVKRKRRVVKRVVTPSPKHTSDSATDELTDDTGVCEECGDKRSARKSWIGCDSYDTWFHYQCTLSLSGMPKGFWCCKYCL